MSQFGPKIRSTDLFIVFCGWFHGEDFASEADRMLEHLRLPKEHFLFLFNSIDEQVALEGQGFRGHFIPQNSWLDEKVIYPRNVNNRYRAIYVARRSAFKRHMLAEGVEGLALVAGLNHGNPISEIPKCDYINDNRLSTSSVCEKISESTCGLSLSAVEGACFASSEYLLCGKPVVSTPSKGGRDVWYDDYNSIMVPPDSEAIAQAVTQLNINRRDPNRIRDAHILKSRYYRERFVDLLTDLFRSRGVQGVDARDYFERNYFHKMRESIMPEFSKIFC